MPAPFPADAVVGATTLSRRAQEIYDHYKWLARWSDEIGKDAALDLKKLAQLGLIHCRRFAEFTANPDLALSIAVARRFAADGIEWATRAAMLADLAAIRTEAAALHTFVRDQVPEAREPSKIGYSDTNDSGTEVILTIPKPHPAVTEVAKLRALFA